MNMRVIPPGVFGADRHPMDRGARIPKIASIGMGTAGGVYGVVQAPEGAVAPTAQIGFMFIK